MAEYDDDFQRMQLFCEFPGNAVMVRNYEPVKTETHHQNVIILHNLSVHNGYWVWTRTATDLVHLLTLTCLILVALPYPW